MVRAFHKAGVEVILDVVFNHTAEGDELGPTLCLRGMDNAIFYTLASDKRYYKDYTGTGNTINANHRDRPAAGRLRQDGDGRSSRRRSGNRNELRSGLKQP